MNQIAFRCHSYGTQTLIDVKKAGWWFVNEAKSPKPLQASRWLKSIAEKLCQKRDGVAGEDNTGKLEPFTNIRCAFNLFEMLANSSV